MPLSSKGASEPLDRPSPGELLSPVGWPDEMVVSGEGVDSQGSWSLVEVCRCWISSSASQVSAFSFIKRQPRGLSGRVSDMLCSARLDVNMFLTALSLASCLLPLAAHPCPPDHLPLPPSPNMAQADYPCTVFCLEFQSNFILCFSAFYLGAEFR